MGLIGQELGSETVFLIGGFKNKKTGKKIGSLGGKIAGSYVPFQNGKIVKPPQGYKSQTAILHTRELVIPKHMVKHFI